MTKKSITRWDLYIGSVFIFAGAVLVMVFLPPPSVEPMGYPLLWLLTGLFLGVVTYVAIYLITSNIDFLRKRALLDLSGFAAVAQRLSYGEIVFISLLAGLGEELLFRVALQGILVEWFSPVAGVLIAALLFGLMHPISLIYVVLTGLFGLLFGLTYHLTQSYLLIAAWHFMYDVFAIGALKVLPGFYSEIKVEHIDKNKIDL